MLRAINDRWMDHLQMIDYIREGIGLRGYGQVDPLVAYKRETFDLFKNTQRGIREQAVKMIYHAQVQREPVQEEAAPAMMRVEEGASSASESGGAVATLAPVDLGSIDWTRVGRNDPCPCGSGKKFKSCHYPDLRAKGMI